MNGTTWLMWLGVALAMAAVEAVTVDFVFLMIALGALAGGIASFLGAGFALSAVVAVVVALALLFTLRPALRKRLRPKRDNTDIGVASLIGATAHVVEPVSDTGGLVRLQGDLWSARCEAGTDIPLGAAVEVQEVRGATVRVVPQSISTR